MPLLDRVLPPWALPIPAAGVGVATYYALSALPVEIDQAANLAPAFTSLSTLYGTVAGFLITAAVFIAGASGKSMARIRATAKAQDVDLVQILAGSMALAFGAAAGLAVCSVFSNGWGAVLAAIVLTWLPLPSILVTLLALMTALRDN